MTTFTRGQSITFRRNGEIMTGTVEDTSIGLWGVRMPNRQYFAVYERDLVEQTPATRAGLKLGDIVVVGTGIKCPHAFRVGEEATFKRDDRSQSPLFEQDGQTQYLDLSEITIGRKPDTRTPAEKAGLKVGDTVKLLNQEYITYFGSEYTVFKRDDGSTMPRFGDEHKSLWLNLNNVQKVEGPRAGVSWSDAPAGCTHYSMHSSHRARWHKLDENGQWFYHEDGRFNDYRVASYAYADEQVAIPGVVVEVNPLNAVFKEVKALEEQVRTRLQSVETLNREVARLNLDKQTKLDQIKAGGFKVEGGKLVKSGKPSSEWQDGDRVRCITRDGRGLANIIVGGLYKVHRRGSDVAVIDGDGGAMRGCVERGCFEYVDSPVNLAAIPAKDWKAGDIVEALESGWNNHRHRSSREFKLVARA